MTPTEKITEALTKAQASAGFLTNEIFDVQQAVCELMEDDQREAQLASLHLLSMIEEANKLKQKVNDLAQIYNV